MLFRSRFSDCTHQHEPRFVVRGAAVAGTVSAMRLDSYNKIRATLPQ